MWKISDLKTEQVCIGLRVAHQADGRPGVLASLETLPNGKHRAHIHWDGDVEANTIFVVEDEKLENQVLSWDKF